MFLRMKVACHAPFAEGDEGNKKNLSEIKKKQIRDAQGDF